MRASRRAATLVVGMALGCGGRSGDMSGAVPVDAAAPSDAIWSKRIGVGTTTAVAFDAAGDLVVAGTIERAFDASLAVPAQDAPPGEWDGFVAAFDRAGRLSWLHRWKDASGVTSDGALVTPLAVATDDRGVWVVGNALGAAVDLDGATLLESGPFRVRYDLAGRLVTSMALPLPAPCATSRCQTWSFALDRAGAVVYVTTLWDSSPGRWLTSCDADGHVVWSRPAMPDDSASLALSQGGTLALYSGTAVAVVGADGSPLWSRGLTSGSISAAAFDARGDLFIGGSFEEQIDLGGPTPLTSPAGPSSNDPASPMFLAKYDPEGHYLLGRAYGSTSRAQSTVYGVRVAANDDYLFTGSFAGVVDFGQGALQAGPDPNLVGNHAVFLARASHDGSVHASAYGAGLCDQGRSLDIAADGRVAMGGMFNKTIDFGAGALDGSTVACPEQFGPDTDSFVAVFPP